MSRILISTVSALALIAGAAQAQDAAGSEDGVTTFETITVTANRTPTEMSKAGSKVEQVTQAQIEEKSLVSIKDYLTLLPGMSFTSYGGIGNATSLYIRGMPGGYVKTLYNGIDISDPTSTQVQAPYEHLMIGGVSGIEVLKGSQSTLYGSNAIAGVVDISTLGQVSDGVSHIVQAEGGSFGTVTGRYGFSGAKDGSRIAANLSAFRTKGISALAGGWERDGYRNVTFDLAADHRINEAFSVFGSLLYIDAKTEFDNWDLFTGDPLPNDATTYGTTETMSGRFGFNLDLLDGRWRHTLSAQAYRMHRESTDAPVLSSYTGTRRKFDYQSSFEVTDRILLQYGADHERQTADTETPDWSGFPPTSHVYIDKSVNLTGIWAQANFEPIDNLVLTAGLRHDDHSVFGGYSTGRATASYLFDQTGTRLHSSYGTGFRAPSLYELYDPSLGDATLRPETSRSFDIGVEQKFLDGSLTADVTYFRLALENYIDFFKVYKQTPGVTRSQGVEFSFAYAAASWLDLGGSYTYTDAKLQSGERRTNLPRHMAVLSAAVKPAEKWTLGGDVKFVSDTVDATGELKDYVLLNAKLAYQLNDSTEIYLRGENLLDQDYQIIRDYNTPGVAAYAGLKAKF